MRRNNVNEINLTIENIDFWGQNEINKGGMRVYWSSMIGFGTLDIVKIEGVDGDDSTEVTDTSLKICAFTEYMDSNDDKEFTSKILDLLKEKINIVN